MIGLGWWSSHRTDTLWVSECCWQDTHTDRHSERKDSHRDTRGRSWRSFLDIDIGDPLEFGTFGTHMCRFARRKVLDTDMNHRLSLGSCNCTGILSLIKWSTSCIHRKSLNLIRRYQDREIEKRHKKQIVCQTELMYHFLRKSIV